MGIGNHEKPNAGGTDIWLTPLHLVDSFGEFDLDPCGHEGHWTATSMYLQPEYDGLKEDWYGRVWLNPPYSDVGRWAEKLANEVDFGDVTSGIALVFARTETKWAQKILPRATSVFFPSGRIRFLTAEGLPGKHTSGAPSMFLSFGETPNWLAVMSGWVAGQ